MKRDLWVGLCLSLALSACRELPTPTVFQTKPATSPNISRIPFEARTQVVTFESWDGTRLAGQFDFPPTLTQGPLVFIIHHSGAVDRDSYQYLAAHLVPAGYAVFRFDKRGTGASQGEYGCCEDEDALAAYRAALTGVHDRVFIIAQSLGTKILAQRWSEFEHIRRPDGVVLLSNLLEDHEITVINVPLHIIISASEPRVAAIGAEAVQAHRAARPDLGASFEIIPNTEHTLFDVSTGPMDWNDPNWPRRFHPAAWQSLRRWLDRHRGP